MKSLNQIDGKKLTMVAWSKDEEGKDDVAVFTGTAVLSESGLSLKRSDDSFLELRDEWIERIEKVPSHLKETLMDADYLFSVSVGNVSDGSDFSGFEETGLKWPK
jgi:hypothetical protein